MSYEEDGRHILAHMVGYIASVVSEMFRFWSRQSRSPHKKRQIDMLQQNRITKLKKTETVKCYRNNRQYKITGHVGVFDPEHSSRVSTWPRN